MPGWLSLTFSFNFSFNVPFFLVMTRGTKHRRCGSGCLGHFVVDDDLDDVVVVAAASAAVVVFVVVVAREIFPEPAKTRGDIFFSRHFSQSEISSNVGTAFLSKLLN